MNHARVLPHVELSKELLSTSKKDTILHIAPKNTRLALALAVVIL